MINVDWCDYTGVLLLLRGVPASGKSTWITESGVNERCVVSSDAIRIEQNGVRVDENGHEYIPQDNPAHVWNEVHDRVESLCASGEPVIVLDATNIKRRDMLGYVDYLDHYNYIGYVVDFTDVTLDEALKRNAAREEYKRVPERVIERMFDQLRGNSVPPQFEVVDRDVGQQIIKKYGA